MHQDKGKLSSFKLIKNSHEEKNINSSWYNFSEEIESILYEESSTFISLISNISGNLKKYKIDGLYSPCQIFNEAYVRAHRRIHEEGYIINKPVPWMRATAFNIIREKSRQAKSSLPFIEDRYHNSYSPSFHDLSREVDSELMKLKLAFQLLAEEDQEILNLRIVDELSWKEIHKEFLLRGFNGTESALRKRKERALKRFRNKYHTMNNSTGD